MIGNQSRGPELLELIRSRWPKMKLSQEIQDAAAVYDALAAWKQPATGRTMPAPGQDVAAHIAAIAMQETAGGPQLQIAHELRDRATRELHQAVRGLVPELKAKVIAEASEHQTKLVELLPTAPREVGTWSTPEQAAAAQELQMAAATLGADLATLRQLEGGVVDRRTRVWSWFAPGVDLRVDTVNQALEESWKLADPYTVEDWERVLPLGVSITTADEAQQRLNRWLEIVTSLQRAARPVDATIRDLIEAPVPEYLARRGQLAPVA